VPSFIQYPLLLASSTPCPNYERLPQKQMQGRHEPGHPRSAAGFYCEVGGLEEAGDAEEVFAGFGVGCGDGGSGV